MVNIRKFLQGIGLIPATSSTIDTKGEMEVLDSSGKLNYHNGSSASPVVTEAHSASLTNKTIDADQNTISNIENADIKAGAAIDASKIADGSVSNAEFQYLDGVSSSIQTQIDSKATSTALTNHINNTTGAHAASAISNSPSGNLAANNVQTALNELQSDVDTRALNSDLTSHTSASSGVHGVTGSVVGTSDSQTLTNKTINALSNVISNIADGEIKANAGINANKIADGSVSNAEFQYLDGVSSSIQTQIDSKASSSSLTTHTSATSGVHGVTGSVVGTSDSQTLTNKTLNSPIVDVLVMDDQASTPSAPAAGYIKTYFKTDGKLYKIDSTAVETEVSSASNATSGKITQASHGFAVGDVLRYNGTAYVKAQADSDANSEVYGMVSEVISANVFRLVTEGYVSGLSGLTAGTTYYLSPLTAGALVSVEPSSGGQISKPVFISDSTSSGYVIQSRGISVGPPSTAALVMSDWIAYTPTFTGLGTVATSAFYYRRIGDTIQIQGKWTTGVSTATEMRISLPSGLTTDSTKVPAIRLVGKWTKADAVSAGNGGQLEVYAESGVSYFTFGWFNPVFNGLSKQTGSGLIGTGIVGALFAEVPVTGWTATSSGQVSAPRSYIRMNTCAGLGSTNTYVPYFTNSSVTGSALTITSNNSTNGAIITANESGLYTIGSTIWGTVGNDGCVGIVKNGTGQYATRITNVSNTYRMAIAYNGAVSGQIQSPNVNTTLYLNAGDTINAQVDGTGSVALNDRSLFEITKVSN